ncbi:conserved hypothetical protein [Chloroherpeton thalassium ATCC 35110]|uniref:DUF5655 domain-containing protein n=1 Tax=Chloroherpeton thalassium (strain ATCC 35110 / GB-78) TaxID=517418 RepID=B3QVF2_CHLT3|nr:DUF5655 domain-containing protein [Chloroherpeton thalassium]ACF14552.1 conserved hypothetical protein [Chloroherpeton thalassium ATCC 35110]
MAIFEVKNGTVKPVKLSQFNSEKELQRLVETNLGAIFNCRFVASEFSTGNVHAGRIDSLAISEDSNPVIIEYKKVASSELITQSLYYLHWMKDHKGDFEMAVNKALGNEIEIDWSDIRVICLAPEYKKYDLHAAQVIGANIELWQYKLYENGVFNIEEVHRKITTATSHEHESNNGKNPVMVEAGRKAAITRKTATYTIEQHSEILTEPLSDLFNDVREYIIGLNEAVEEVPKKRYVAYKTSQNFACLQIYKTKITVYLKLNPDEVGTMPTQGRDVRAIGHFGTGDFELTIKSFSDFEETKHLINEALKNIGG